MLADIFVDASEASPPRTTKQAASVSSSSSAFTHALSAPSFAGSGRSGGEDAMETQLIELSRQNKHMHFQLKAEQSQVKALQEEMAALKAEREQQQPHIARRAEERHAKASALAAAAAAEGTAEQLRLQLQASQQQVAQLQQQLKAGLQGKEKMKHQLDMLKVELKQTQM